MKELDTSPTLDFAETPRRGNGMVYAEQEQPYQKKAPPTGNLNINTLQNQNLNSKHRIEILPKPPILPSRNPKEYYQPPTKATPTLQVPPTTGTRTVKLLQVNHSVTEQPPPHRNPEESCTTTIDNNRGLHTIPPFIFLLPSGSSLPSAH